MDAARAEGLKRMEGEVLASNQAMLHLAAGLNLIVRGSPGDRAVKRVVKEFFNHGPSGVLAEGSTIGDIIPP